MTPYIEPPDIPEGMTIEDYRRARSVRCPNCGTAPADADGFACDYCRGFAHRPSGQRPFTRSHHRISSRMRAGTLAGAMGGDPRALRGLNNREA